MTPSDPRPLASRRVVAVGVALGAAASLVAAMVLFVSQLERGLAAAVGASLVPGLVGGATAILARRLWGALVRP